MHYSPVIQPLFSDSNYHVDVLRLDVMDESISGNKWFKLKNNLARAKKESHQQLLTFGGAYSNHIAATAAACKRFQIKSIGIIRGERPGELNPTLKRAEQEGMHLHFVSREMYAQKNNDAFLNDLKTRFGSYYLVPEGGNNEEGILGCREILEPTWNYDYVFCACGTGATFSGLLSAVSSHTSLVGISVLKGENKMPSEVTANLQQLFPENNLRVAGNEELMNSVIENHVITNAYAFKGYASCDSELISFKKEFEKKYSLKLDYVYTNKLAFALVDLMRTKKLRINSKILFIHSGGLQGNEGFEKRYQLNEIR